MNDTPAAADDVMKLLDRGDAVFIFRNDLGSYTAVSVRLDAEPGHGLRKAVKTILAAEGLRGVTLTDDFTPSKVLYRLAEKATTGRIA